MCVCMCCVCALCVVCVVCVVPRSVLCIVRFCHCQHSSVPCLVINDSSPATPSATCEPSHPPSPFMLCLFWVQIALLSEQMIETIQRAKHFCPRGRLRICLTSLFISLNFSLLQPPPPQSQSRSSRVWGKFCCSLAAYFAVVDSLTYATTYDAIRQRNYPSILETHAKFCSPSQMQLPVRSVSSASAVDNHPWNPVPS